MLDNCCDNAIKSLGKIKKKIYSHTCPNCGKEIIFDLAPVSLTSYGDDDYESQLSRETQYYIPTGQKYPEDF